MHAGPMTDKSETDRAPWLRSTRCESGDCVEVMLGADVVLMRNSNWAEDVLAFSPGQWAAFVASLRDEDC